MTNSPMLPERKNPQTNDAGLLNQAIGHNSARDLCREAIEKAGGRVE